MPRYATLMELGLGALIAVILWARVFVVAGVLTVFLGMLFAGPRIDYWVMKRNLRKSPFYLREITATLDERGYSEVGELSTSMLTWAVFTKVFRVEDGFLLQYGPKAFHWLPDRTLVQGTVGEVEALLRSAVAEYAG
jgi:hypothetical protein